MLYHNLGHGHPLNHAFAFPKQNNTAKSFNMRLTTFDWPSDWGWYAVLRYNLVPYLWKISSQNLLKKIVTIGFNWTRHAMKMNYVEKGCFNAIKCAYLLNLSTTQEWFPWLLIGIGPSMKSMAMSSQTCFGIAKCCNKPPWCRITQEEETEYRSRRREEEEKKTTAAGGGETRRKRRS